MLKARSEQEIVARAIVDIIQQAAMEGHDAISMGDVMLALGFDEDAIEDEHWDAVYNIDAVQDVDPDFVIAKIFGSIN